MTKEKLLEAMEGHILRVDELVRNYSKEKFTNFSIGYAMDFVEKMPTLDPSQIYCRLCLPTHSFPKSSINTPLLLLLNFIPYLIVSFPFCTM